VRATYEAHRERIGVRASIDATARDTNLSAEVVSWILGFDRLPNMNASTIFGPCGRFRIDPVWIDGQCIAHDLFDAEAGHSPPRVGRFVFASEAFAAAARRVAPADRERTSQGERWRPL